MSTIEDVRNEFKAKGYVQINDVFPDFLDMIRRECTEKFSSDYKPHAAPFVGDTVVHRLDLEETFSLNLLFKSYMFLEKMRAITDIPDLVVVHRDQSLPYESNLYSSKLALYYSGGQSLIPHFDRLVFEGDQIALVYTALTQGGDPMKIKMESINGAVDELELVEDSLTIHDARMVYHTVMKPDENTQRIAFMLQYTNKGLKPKTGLKKIASRIDAIYRSAKGRLGYVKTN